MKFEGKEENGLLYFAGLWRREEDGEHFVVLTTEANESMKSTHDRMPLILRREELPGWIGQPGRGRLVPDSSGQGNAVSVPVERGKSDPALPEAVRAALNKIPEELRKSAEYEQLSLFKRGI